MFTLSYFSAIFLSRPRNLESTRLVGNYRWREFPLVNTGNYRPGKYSQNGAYRELLGNIIFFGVIVFANLCKCVYNSDDISLY